MSKLTLANGWEALGLPAPEMSSYSYRVDTGLLRTPFDAPRPRQRRKHTSWNRAFSLTFQLSQAELRLAEEALTSEGYSWFPIRLISRDGVLVDHRVRLSEPWQVSAFSPTHFTLTLQVEMCNVFTFYYSPLYPVELSESLISNAPEGLSGNFSTPVWHESDSLSGAAPGNFGGTLALTVAWRYLAIRDDVSGAAPGNFGGTLVQTVFWRYLAIRDDLSGAAPGNFGGTLALTVAWIYYDTADATSSSAPSGFSGTLEHS